MAAGPSSPNKKPWVRGSHPFARFAPITARDVLQMCALDGGPSMQQIGARELKQHTGDVIERIQRGERLLLTNRGRPIAIITPIDRAAFDQLLDREAEDAASLAWLAASESAFEFWDNAEDQDWDRVQSRPLE